MLWLSSFHFDDQDSLFLQMGRELGTTHGGEQGRKAGDGSAQQNSFTIASKHRNKAGSDTLGQN